MYILIKQHRCKELLETLTKDKYLELPNALRLYYQQKGSDYIHKKMSVKKTYSSINIEKPIKISYRENRGSNATYSKLTEEQILEIRAKYKNGTIQRKLANEYKVATKTISSIVKRQSWRHV